MISRNGGLERHPLPTSKTCSDKHHKGPHPKFITTTVWCLSLNYLDCRVLISGFEREKQPWFSLHLGCSGNNSSHGTELSCKGHNYISAAGHAGSRGLESAPVHSHLETGIDLDELKDWTCTRKFQGDRAQVWSLVSRSLCNAQSSSFLCWQVTKLFAEALKYSGKLDSRSLFHYRQTDSGDTA